MSRESSSSVSAEHVGAGYWAAQEAAAARLEAMARAEDELSEEQLQANDQLQEDELLALQAIYGDDIVIFNNKDGLRFFQISLHYQLPDGIRVYLNVSPSGTIESGADDDDDHDDDQLLYACTLQHLPPIVLTCLLPRSYPSTRSPYFAIVAKWLDEPEVSSFCAVLDEIWAELPGQEVVFRWVDWLSSSSWSCIASDGNLILGPDASSSGGDERAIGRSLCLDSTIPLMHRYSEKRSHEIFVQRIHECGVCLSENTGRHFIRLPCHHSFCLKCMETYCRIHVKEGSVTRLTCPETSCRSPLPPSVLKSLLGDDDYARWESFVLQRMLDTMPDLVYCPRCNAACLAADNDAQCSKCFFTFCSECGERRHVGNTCVAPENKLDILMERQKKSSLSERQLLKERRKIEELLSLREVLRGAKQCPSCKMAIARTEGCNKMVCGNCGKYFCYRCNRAISGYEHFIKGKCGLFEHVGKGRFPGQQVRMNQGQDFDEDVEIVEPGWIRALRYPCPTCGFKRTKVSGNNHLVCRVCRTQYCALCWKRVWKVSEHYGPSGCQQHNS